MDYLALDNEPPYRPKVFKVMVKQYGLRKVVRVRNHSNGDI